MNHQPIYPTALNKDETMCVKVNIGLQIFIVVPHWIDIGKLREEQERGGGVTNLLKIFCRFLGR